MPIISFSPSVIKTPVSAVKCLRDANQQMASTKSEVKMNTRISKLYGIVLGIGVIAVAATFFFLTSESPGLTKNMAGKKAL